jgi:REP element-mobilizing transposase RayT
MANVYTQINIHAVFAVQGRQNLLTKPVRERLFPYIAGILRNTGIYPLAVNGWQDHVHIFFEMKPDISLSKTMELVKSNASKWLNEQGLIRGKFSWQRGYGGFSYSRSQRNNVINYIATQEEHHQKAANTFRTEYLKILEDFAIAHDPQYLFDFYD